MSACVRKLGVLSWTQTWTLVAHSDKPQQNQGAALVSPRGPLGLAPQILDLSLGPVAMVTPLAAEHPSGSEVISRALQT